MNKTAKKEAKIDLAALNENRLSKYSLIIDLFSLTTFALLISVLMLMHKKFSGAVYENWVIIVVGISLELFFIGLAVLDSIRKNPLERLFGSRIFNLPVFTITVLVITAIYWGKGEQLAIVYGAICGGFAGYLAGGLAYGNFFVKIKDSIFRIIFGGWIGISIGAIFGALFAGLVDPFGGKVFGGIFMGFWGGAIISGPLAVVLLVVLEKNISFRNFFTKLLVYDVYKKVKESTEDVLLEAVNEDSKIITKYLTDLELLNVSEDIDETKESEVESFWNRFLRIFLYIIFLINPWEIESEINRVNAYRDIYALYFSERYEGSIKKDTEGMKFKLFGVRDDEGNDLRKTIIRAIECIPVERSKELIILALKDPSHGVVMNAIKSVGHLKLKEALPPLLEIQYQVDPFTAVWSPLERKYYDEISKNANSTLEKLLDKKLNVFDKLAYMIVYTYKDSLIDKETQINISAFVPEGLIKVPIELLGFYYRIIEVYKEARKMSKVNKNQIEEIIYLLILTRIKSDDLEILIRMLVDENLTGILKKMYKHYDVFI